MSRGFDTWRDVREAARSGEALYYKAPLDYQARHDRHHLDRFSR
jgi:hypothetical protein